MLLRSRRQALRRGIGQVTGRIPASLYEGQTRALRDSGHSEAFDISLIIGILRNDSGVTSSAVTGTLNLDVTVNGVSIGTIPVPVGP